MTTFWEFRPLLLLFGAGQGLVVSSLCLLPASGNRRARFALAGLTFLVAVQLLEATLALTGGYARFPDLIFVTRPTTFLIGPLLWLYVRSLVRPSRAVRSLDLVHGLPAAVCLVQLAPFFARTGSEKLAVFHSTFGAGPGPVYLFFWTVYVLQLALYGAAAVRQLSSYERAWRSSESGGRILRVHRLRNVLSLFVAHVVINAFVVAGLHATGRYSSDADFASLAVLAILVFAMAWSTLRDSGFLFPDLGSLRTASAAAPREAASTDRARPRYATSALDEERRRDLLARLDAEMNRRRAWENGSLRLADLARFVGVPPHQVSEALNAGAGRSFYDYVNGYRIEAALRRLRDRQPGETILEIALEVGFHQKKSFHAAFRKATGTTPTAWLRDHPSADSAADDP